MKDVVRINELDKGNYVLVSHSLLVEISQRQLEILRFLHEGREQGNSIGDFIPESEAQKLLGRKVTWFWNMRKKGALSFSKVGNRIFYSKADILKLLLQNKSEK